MDQYHLERVSIAADPNPWMRPLEALQRIEQSTGRPIEWCGNQLRLAAAREELVVVGEKAGACEPMAISGTVWESSWLMFVDQDDSTFHDEFSTRNGLYRRVRFRRDDVLRRWPDPYMATGIAEVGSVETSISAVHAPISFAFGSGNDRSEPADSPKAAPKANVPFDELVQWTRHWVAKCECNGKHPARDRHHPDAKAAFPQHRVRWKDAEAALKQVVPQEKRRRGRPSKLEKKVPSPDFPI
jgi:hypothetical protein